MLPDLKKIIEKHTNILHSDPEMVKMFPTGVIKPIYRRNKNLKELISPSAFHKMINKSKFSLNFCEVCDLCKNYLIKSSKFECTKTGKIYNIRAKVSCNCKYVIYLVICKLCLEQYVGSTENFKPRVRLHKSDNNLNRSDRCGAAKHFNEKCKHPELGPNGYFSIQIIEVIPPKQCNEDYLWKREKYWQAQLFTLTHGMNSLNDWYCKKRKGHSNMNVTN